MRNTIVSILLDKWYDKFNKLSNTKAMLMQELRKKKEQLTFIVKKYGARNLKVFGSVIRGEEKKRSDVDMLVYFPRGYSLIKQRLPLQWALEKAIGKRVDLIVEHELNKHLKPIILKEAREL